MEKFVSSRNPIFYKKAYETLINHYIQLKDKWKISQDAFISICDDLTQEYIELLNKTEKQNHSNLEWYIFELVDNIKAFISKLI